MIKRSGIASLVLSALALVGIAGHEGYMGTAYDDGVGVQTIGFGTTDGVRPGDTITPVRALIRLAADARDYERSIKRCITVPLHQHEYDAFVSLAYNIGPGAFCGSTLARKANAGDYTGACNEMTRWVYAGGKRLRGLEIRRDKERQQCLGQGG